MIVGGVCYSSVVDAKWSKYFWVIAVAMPNIEVVSAFLKLEMVCNFFC